MPDIIKQLEAGKKLQEEEGIDVDSLRTKLNSEEESTEKPKSKRGRKKKEKSEEKQSSEDPFAQAEQLLNDEKPVKQEQEYKHHSNAPEGFDFNNFYEVGQTVYYVKINEAFEEKVTYELKIRTIYPEMFVGVIKNTYLKGRAQCVYYGDIDNIFSTLIDAEVYRKSIEFNTNKTSEPEDEIPIQLTEAEEQ